VILVLGGSLGAGTVNTSIGGAISTIEASGVQMIWQTGSHWYDRMREAVEEQSARSIMMTGFINRMDLAYAAADVIISRAGAGTISELALVGKPVILVPSPNVAEDHQTHNAMALVNRGAALLVRDADAQGELIGTALELIRDDERRSSLSENIKKLAIRNSDEVIAREVLKLARR
jgi:UDP-N-acetylglucosamine--N-acetylmuramyl-(pentapeptide) pyrophosphoryl-undecaprenol N-acetylglucosamine transferase